MSEFKHTLLSKKDSHLISNLTGHPFPLHSIPMDFTLINIINLILLFLVEPYYAVIHDFKHPTVVDAGETFDVVVGVDYKFPDDTPLRISHSYPADATAVEQFDTVMGDGIGTYTYSVTAPTPPPAVPGESELLGYNGSAWVEFDRGSGWQHTDPG